MQDTWHTKILGSHGRCFDVYIYIDFFWAGMIQMPCFSHHGSMHVYPTHTHIHPHSCTISCLCLIVGRNKAIQRLHSPSESCITSIIMLYQTFHHLLSDAQHLHPWCIKWWIILCATYYPRSTGIHIYICISNERVIINISKFIFIPMLAQCW